MISAAFSSPADGEVAELRETLLHLGAAGPAGTVSMPAATASATSTCGMQEDFTQPRRPQSHGGPSGSTMIWPISPAFPEVPRTTSSLRTMPQPMPVPMYIKTKLPAPLGPPAQVSATAALVTSLSTRTE